MAKDGNNSATGPQISNEMTDDQRYSLTAQHKDRYVLLLKAKKEADSALTAFGKIIKSDLGIEGLKNIKDLITMATPEGEEKLKAEMERQARVMRWLNIPIGTQGALFGDADRTPITERAYAAGKRQGLAGERHDNPHHVSTEAHTQFNEGFKEGQLILSQGFKKTDPAAAVDSLAKH